MTRENRMRSDTLWEEISIPSSVMMNLENRLLRMCGHLKRMEEEGKIIEYK
jgi:hypothetical protein